MTTRRLNEATQKLIAVSDEIFAVRYEWREVQQLEHPTDGLSNYIEDLLERDWRKHRKFPRVKNELVELYDRLDKARAEGQ